MVTEQTATKRAANGARAGRESGNAWESFARDSARERAAFIRGAMRKIKLNKAPRAARDFTHGGAVPHVIGLDDLAGKVAHRATVRAAANRMPLPFAEAKEEARGAAAEIVAALCAPDEAAEAARETLARFKVSPEAAPHGAAFLGAARAVDRMHRKMSHGDTVPEDYAHGAESRDDLPEAARAFALRGAYDKARALVRRAFIVHGCHVRSIQQKRGQGAGTALRHERAALRRDLRFIRRAFAYKRAVITSGAPSGRIGFTLRISSGVSPEGSGAKVRGDWSLREKNGTGAPRRARAAWANMLRDYRATAARLGLPELVAADLLRA
jgi:hypothetical protein